jgi:CYTH domain-containing protein
VHRQLKYGRIERERRWLLPALPDRPWDRVVQVVDRYIRGTRLRLRMMDDGTTVDHKLARKLPPHEPGALVMGNLYLSAGEHALLRSLPAHELRKRRHVWGRWGVDVFEGPLAGLVLAEIEEDDPAVLAALVPPFAVIRDVTGEPAFQGATLAVRG